MAYRLLEPITFILEPNQMAEIAVNLDFDLPIWHNPEFIWIRSSNQCQIDSGAASSLSGWCQEREGVRSIIHMLHFSSFVGNVTKTCIIVEQDNLWMIKMTNRANFNYVKDSILMIVQSATHVSSTLQLQNTLIELTNWLFISVFPK